ncbi:DNA helicase rad5 [Tulasnella sp. 330]|nr:DNA helicase rad5 [Tulasnella sp. 330]KAG8885343.1 DNA helicase rad5 [Tulasnella sp. 331]
MTPTTKPLFLQDSDDELENPSTSNSKPDSFGKPNFFGSDDDLECESAQPFVKRRHDETIIDDVLEEVIEHEAWTARSPMQSALSSSSSQNLFDEIEIEDSDEDEELPKLASSPPSRHGEKSPPTKRRRLSPDIHADASRLSVDPKLEAPMASSQPPPRLPHSKSTYLGEMIVSEAWATCSGKGILATGESVRIHLELVDEDEAGSSKKANGKKLSSSSKGNSKQTTLTSMMKREPPKTSKKTDNFIVRFSNKKGQGAFLRDAYSTAVPATHSMKLWHDERGWSSSDTEIRLDCQTSGKWHDKDRSIRDRLSFKDTNSIMLSLRIFLEPSAFITPSESIMYAKSKKSRRKDWDLMHEGAETAQEKNLSDRKRSLLKLFQAMSVRPRRDKAVKDVDSALAFTQEKKPVVKRGKTTEVVGEGDEVEEVEAEGEELTGNQLSVIYQKAQQHDAEMEEIDPAETFALTLRPYQRQALNLENCTRDARDAHSMHPLWEEFIFPFEPRDGVIDLCEEEQPFYYNPYSGELSLDFPRAERDCKGGILADEMGMGKSIMVSALLHTNSTPDTVDSHTLSEPTTKTRKQPTLNFKFASRSNSRARQPSATLIVAPLSLLSQWKAEVDRSSQRGSMKTVIFHGTTRRDLETLTDTEDENEHVVIITSYGTLASEHARVVKGGQSSFYEVEWLRVVLDEAHYIKSRHTKTAKACYAINATRRWCLTGTPIVNRLEDLHSLLHFLRDEPWSDFVFFKSAITTPFLNQDPRCLDVIQIVLESVLLRREKTMKDRNGKSIVSLPPKEVVTEQLEFSPMERKIYDSIFADAKHAYDALNARGAVGKNMSNILAMLMRLRRAVLHPSLIQRTRAPDDDDDDDVMEVDAEGNGPVDIDAMIAQFGSEADTEDQKPSSSDNTKFAVGVLKDLKKIQEQECPLCLDTVQEAVLIPECHHAGCKECIVELIQAQEERGEEGFCPVCQHRPVSERSLLEVMVRKGRESFTTPTSSPSVTLRTNDFVGSTKLDALAKHLRRLREEDPSFRAIVFSQFTGFLDLIGTMLQREGYAQYRLDGQLPQKQRTHVLQDFAEPSNTPKVFAISLKAGGVGLNLTNANHVIMMDSWWNRAVEEQAIDRVHRIGQDKTVYVTHFVIAHTIEERILSIQRKKTAIVKSALGGKGKKDQEAFDNLKIMFSG